MTNQQILEQAIQKAIDGGWKRPSWAPNISVENLAWDSLDRIPYWQSFVYSRDFAKALWGDDLAMFAAEDISKGEYGEVTLPGLEWWQYHLQQMVIADDPIKYLGENMNEEEK